MYILKVYTQIIIENQAQIKQYQVSIIDEDDSNHTASYRHVVSSKWFSTEDEAKNDLQNRLLNIVQLLSTDGNGNILDKDDEYYFEKNT